MTKADWLAAGVSLGVIGVLLVSFPTGVPSAKSSSQWEARASA